MTNYDVFEVVRLGGEHVSYEPSLDAARAVIERSGPDDHAIRLRRLDRDEFPHLPPRAGYFRRRNREAAAAGICSWCRTAKREPDRSLCAKCGERNRRNAAARRRRK